MNTPPEPLNSLKTAGHHASLEKTARSYHKTSSFLTKTTQLLAGARGVTKPFTLTVVGTIYTRIAALGDLSLPFTPFTETAPQHKPAPSELAGTHAAISNDFSAATVS